MNVATLVDRIQATAVQASDDRVSNFLTKLARRLEVCGLPGEKPLTHEERRFIEKFMD